MKNRRGKEYEQFIIFLIREDEKKVYIDVTSSKEPAAVLRRHWRGEDEDTKALFSKLNSQAEPVMWLWKAGMMTRSKAKAYAVEWERLFDTEGYEIVGNKIPDSFRGDPPMLSVIELLEVRKLHVSQLMNGDIGEKIECSAEGGGRRCACQKFTTEPTDAILRIRAKGETVNRFLDICNDRGLTLEQGLELLMASYTGNANHLILDLQERLERANDHLMLKDERIGKLREALRKSEEAKEYPKKYRRAELQGKLLREFFNRLPECQRGKNFIYSAATQEDMSFPKAGYIVIHRRRESLQLLCSMHVLAREPMPAFIFTDKM